MATPLSPLSLEMVTPGHVMSSPPELRVGLFFTGLFDCPTYEARLEYVSSMKEILAIILQQSPAGHAIRLSTRAIDAPAAAVFDFDRVIDCQPDTEPDDALLLDKEVTYAAFTDPTFSPVAHFYDRVTLLRLERCPSTRTVFPAGEARCANRYVGLQAFVGDYTLSHLAALAQDPFTGRLMGNPAFYLTTVRNIQRLLREQSFASECLSSLDFAYLHSHNPEKPYVLIAEKNDQTELHLGEAAHHDFDALRDFLRKPGTTRLADVEAYLGRPRDSAAAAAESAARLAARLAEEGEALAAVADAEVMPAEGRHFLPHEFEAPQEHRERLQRLIAALDGRPDQIYALLVHSDFDALRIATQPEPETQETGLAAQRREMAGLLDAQVSLEARRQGPAPHS